MAVSVKYEQLASELRKAMKGLGTDDAKLIAILGATPNADLQAVRQAFTRLFQRDLIDDIASETSGNYKECAKLLCYSHAELDAVLAHKAVSGLGTNEDLLTEVLCTRTPTQLQAAASAYRALYSKELVQDVKDDVSGHYKKLVTTVLTCPRSQMPPLHQVDADIESLYKAGEAKWGTDEDKFIELFGTRPMAYVEGMAAQYAAKYNHTMDQVVKSEFSGDLKRALLTLASPKIEYYAERLYKSMKGTGTDDSSLVRLIVALKERGLKEVTALFAVRYKKTLVQFIEGDTGGDYRKLLISIVEHFGK